MRNDLSRVCSANSIRVPELCKLETCASVHHLVSMITGELAAIHDAVSRRLWLKRAESLMPFVLICPVSFDHYHRQLRFFRFQRCPLFSYAWRSNARDPKRRHNGK
nr:chorismate-binding protein [Bradyrhizobium japonicum]